MGRNAGVASGIIVSLLTTVFGASGRCDEPKPDVPPTADILGKMGKAYAGCKTYRDSGMVKTDFIRPGGDNFTSKKPFTTAFIRPDQFRYEFKDTMSDGRVNRFIIWRNGDDVRSWWDVKPGVQKQDSLNLPVASGTGISSSSAHTVPALLLPDEVSGRKLTELTEAKHIDDAKLGETDCYRVEGKFGNQPLTLWVDKGTFLLRRIDQTTTFADFRTEETTTYDPVINGEIDASLLKFDHPEPK